MQQELLSIRFFSYSYKIMKYIEFRDLIKTELIKNPEGCTWTELRDRLALPYERPCPTWVQKLEKEIKLKRCKGQGWAFVWKISDHYK